jgi:hypothetical protein
MVLFIYLRDKERRITVSFFALTRGDIREENANDNIEFLR